MRKVLGNFYKGVGRVLEIITEILIVVLDLVIGLIDNVRKLFAVFGLLIILGLIFPFLGIILLMNRYVQIALLVFFVVPVLGKGLINFLRYSQYVITEYFYDKSEYYLTGKSQRFTGLGGYSADYWRKKEEAQRRESQRRAYEQQKMWEEMFRNYYEQASRNSNYGGQYTNNSGNFYNPTNDFITKYKESCRILGIEPTTDKYAIKLAYRKMAKKYHPDINKSPDATEKFQKINEANEFLSEANIDRYEKLTKNL